jgi:serine/threonine protein kinase
MKWATEIQKKLEWTIANQYLRDDDRELLASGTKIKRGSHINKETQSIVHLTHSFIVFDKILALGDTNDYIEQKSKKGSVKARIKFAQDEEGQLYGLKIEAANDLKLGELTSENQIAVDLNVAIPGGRRQIANKTWKCYSPYFYFNNGTLHHHLSVYKKDLSLDSSCLIAIQMATIVHNLHMGSATKSGKKYAHLDLKPANTVVDNIQLGTLKLIDLGYAEELEGKATHFRGTPGYLPANPLSYTKQNLDIFSLLRILYMPKQIKIQTISGNRRPVTWTNRNESNTWIFSDELVDKTPRLRALLARTNDSSFLQLSALEIMRELTIIRCHLDGSFESYLLSEMAIQMANYLFTNQIIILKKYFAQEIIDKIMTLDDVTTEAVQACLASEQKEIITKAPSGRTLRSHPRLFKPVEILHPLEKAMPQKRLADMSGPF